MAFDTANWPSRRNPVGIRSLDHLETGIRRESKRVPGAHRIRNDGSVSKIGYYQDLVRIFIILCIFAASSGAAVVQIIWGHW